MSHDRRPRKPTLHERLDRLFYLSWKRNEKLKERLRNIMSAYTDLTREVEETRTVIMAKLAEMQAEIDIIKADPADVAAVTAAAAALDQLQSDITGAVPPPAEPPVEPVP